jgi:hypothetical protein
VAAVFLIGVGVGLYFRRADAARHSSIGRLVFEEHSPEALPAAAGAAG